MFSGPLLMSLIPGAVILLLTWWFRKMNFPISAQIIPGILTVIAAIVLFYIGFVNIRGFEGAAYGILAFFLIIFAFISFIIAGIKIRK